MMMMNLQIPAGDASLGMTVDLDQPTTVQCAKNTTILPVVTDTSAYPSILVNQSINIVAFFPSMEIDGFLQPLCVLVL